MRSALAVLLAASLIGCSTARQPTFDGPVYPAGLTKLGTYNVQVEVGDHDLELTSGTARVVGPGTLWLNRWYATEIDALAPGEQMVIALGRFRDENGLPPRGGGFFATRDRTEIVVVEIVTDDGAHVLRLLGERQ